jgi:hypothetical protein
MKQQAMGDRKSVDAKMSGRAKGKTRIKNYAPSITGFKSEGE